MCRQNPMCISNLYLFIIQKNKSKNPFVCCYGIVWRGYFYYPGTVERGNVGHFESFSFNIFVSLKGSIPFLKL